MAFSGKLFQTDPSMLRESPAQAASRGMLRIQIGEHCGNSNNSRAIDIYLTNFERKSTLVNGVITKVPDFALSRTGANTNFATLAVYRHLERLGM